MAIRVMIVDDHEVVRSGLRSLLGGSEIEVVGEAVDGHDALAKALEWRPDVILLDIRMPERDGLDVLSDIHKQLPNTRVIVLSTYDNPTYIARAITLGASDYLLKGVGRDELLRAITAVMSSATPAWSPEVRRVAGTLRTTSMVFDEGEMPLTQRESQVLRHVALGLSNKEIGQSLSISVETVKEHVQNILRKIECTDRTQAAVWAVRKGLV
jgi:DNA-binding NarL/FixJ family response regulator